MTQDLQKIEKQKTAAVPKLRFKEFEEEWKQFKFKELVAEIRLGGNYSNSENKSNKPLIKMGNLGRGKISLKKIHFIDDDEKIDERDRIKYGDLFFNTRNTLDLVGKVAIWRNELPLAYYNSNLMFMKFSNNFFMNYRFNSFQGIKSLRRLATGTTSVAAIYTKDLLKLKISVPTHEEEQQKIASFLSAVDKKIQQLTFKKALLETYKKGVMQQLFSQEIRFRDEDGKEFPEWGNKKLGEIAAFSKGKGVSKNDIFEDGSLSCVRYGELYTHYHETIEHTISKTNTAKEDLILSEAGDVIIPASGETRLDIATASCVIKEGIALGGDLNIIRGDFNGVFLAYFLNNHLKTEIARLSQGSSVIHLYSSQLKKLKLIIPSAQEQQKIADFLSAIDRKIEAVSQQIEKTQTFKKGLLQQMFV